MGFLNANYTSQNIVRLLVGGDNYLIRPTFKQKDRYYPPIPYCMHFAHIYSDH